MTVSEDHQLKTLINDLVADTTTTSSSTQPDISYAEKENFDVVSYTIKQVLQSDQQVQFESLLDKFIDTKEAEIERICSLHYQEFVAAIDQLLKVRQETVSLREKIHLLNDKMSESGSSIIEKKKEMIEYQKVLTNTDAALDAIKSCLFVLDLTNKINNQIEAKKFYSALRLLDDMDNTHLKKVIQYSFAQQLQASIPMLKGKIRETVLLDLKEWYVRVREISKKVGSLAISNTKLRQEKVRAQRESVLEYSTSANVSVMIDIAMCEENTEDVLDNSELRLNFRPLYQCIHIHSVLGLDKMDELKLNYEENRHLQAELVLASNNAFKNGNVDYFEHFLQEVVGYFIIESTVVNTTQDFRPLAKVEMLWDNVVGHINTLISENLKECREASAFLSIKLSIVAFMQTMEVYGYAGTKLTDLMISLFDRYADLLKVECQDKILDIIDNDEFCLLTVNTHEELSEINAKFPLDDETLGAGLTYPFQLPFSKGVPAICQHINTFIDKFYKFAEGFQQQNNEMDDLLKKSLENMLSKSVTGALLDLLQSNNLSQTIQILVNLRTFEKACTHFGNRLSEYRMIHGGSKVVVDPVSTFRGAKGKCEKKIFELINMKIDDFLELAEYDWVATKVNTEESSYLHELVDYITLVIASTLSNLPSDLKQYIYFGAFEHLAGSLKILLLDDQVSKITMTGVLNFDKDLAFLESFIKVELPQDVNNINECFTELRQTVDLLKGDKYEEFLDVNIRRKLYPKVQVHNVITMLEKFKVEGSGYFGNASAEQKARKKRIDHVIKSLRH